MQGSTFHSDSAVVRVALVLWCGLSVSVAGGAAAPSSNLLGATGVLARIPQILAASQATNQTATAASSRMKLKNDLAAFASATNLAPEMAAVDWLSLLDRFWTLSPDNGEEYQLAMITGEGADRNLSLESILAAIPGPQSWPALQKQVSTRKLAEGSLPGREAQLRFLVALLSGDVPAMQSAISSLQVLEKKADRYARDSLRDTIRQLQAGMLRSADSQHPESSLAAFRKMLGMQERDTAEEVRISIPDLAALTDATEALQLIDRALAIPNVIVTVPAGPDTRALVQRRIVAMLDRIAKPQWAMVCTADSAGVTLFEALDRKFGKKKTNEPAAVSQTSRFQSPNAYSHRSSDDDGSARQARHFYVFGLLVVGRRAEAMTFALAMDPDEMDWISRHESRPMDSATLFAFVDELYRRRPELRLCGQYATLALEAGKTTEAMALLRKHEPAKVTTVAQLRDMHERVTAYLKLDEINQAATLIRKVLVMDTSRMPADAQIQAVQTRLDLALLLARIGKLLHEPSWVGEGLAAALSTCRQKWSSERNGNYPYETDQVVQALLEHQQYEAAEAFVLDAMAASPKQSGMGEPEGEGAARESHMQFLLALMRIYAAAGRPADVVLLLDQAPWWGVPDLANLRNRGYGCGEASIESCVATALHDTGHDADAVRILKPYLYEHAGDDAAYRVLTAIEGPGLIPWLDELYARDRFEERPLIWKASILLKDGKLDEAEKIVRDALKIDPTDGEEKAGDRVLAYGVLADILLAKGKKDDAAFFRNVVQSVRMAEEGDKFTESGLLARSLPLYEKAQGLFADAYCIQWRIAERLSAMGKPDEAEAHYRIAFERMPEQFGQVASFCFGCEGVFRSGPSRSTAERILTTLEKSGPKRPQVYYLLGQLREAQERLTEAYGYYQKAVDMDPEYLDAWGKLEGLNQRLFLPQAERDALALRMLKIDPGQRHAHVSLGEVYDFKGLWQAVAANQKYNWTPPKSIYPLKASTEKMGEDKKKADPRRRGFDGYRPDFMEYNRDNLPTPGRAISKNATVRSLISNMQYGGAASGGESAEIEPVVE